MFSSLTHPAPITERPGLSLVDRLSRRSTLIFTLLAVLAGCAYYLLASQTADERASAAEINLAGRRRMLSQQIGLLASQLQHRSGAAEMAELDQAVQEMATIHQTLIQGTADRSIRPLPAALQADFYATGGSHAKIVHFLELTSALSAIHNDSEAFREGLQQVVQLSRGDILKAVDQLVTDYQHLSEAKSDALRRQQWLVLIAALALIAYSALGVLRPLIAAVRRSLDDLESSEAALRHTIAENRLILDTTDDGLFGVDRNGRIRFVNPAAAQMLGIDAHELIGHDHHPAILATRDDCPICTALQHTERQKVESSHFIRHQGQERAHFAVEYSVVPRPDGRGAVVSFRDISERQRAEERVQRLRQRLVDAIEAMDDAFALFDADDCLGLYNLRFTEFFPLSGEHGPLGMSFPDFIREVAKRGLYAQVPDNLESWIAERLAAHRQANGSIEIPCSDGRWLRATERKTREGGIVVIWSDVTHLKHALIAADRGSRAKSEFLSRMSHELRTPLNAILGFAQVLELGSSDSLNQEQREYIGHILQGGRHLLSLINEVLDMSAIEAGKLSIETSEVGLAELSDECLTLVSPLAANRGIRMLREIPATAIALADRKRLKQVLLNLLSNAIKYNRQEGEVRVTCDSDGSHLRLGVHDTGNGIPETQADRVFQPFERLGCEDVEGTGIGLAITRRLVELMGGSIDFDSRPGQGTSFWLQLPLAHPGLDAASRCQLPENLPQTAVDRSKAVVAVALDRQTGEMLELICRTLGNTRLLLCNEVEEALAAARRESCLTIITGSSTLPLLQNALRDTVERPPLLLLTAAADAAVAQAAEFCHTLPLNPRQMARTLRELAHAS